MKEIVTRIAIKASPAKVWSVLLDFNAYASWNPFISNISGNGNMTGSNLEVTINPPGKKAMVFRPKVLESRSAKILKWRGKLLFPGVFDGEHRFEIVETEDGVNFIQAEVFSGVLSGVILKMAHDATKQGFEEMNAALKKQCESV